MSRYILAIDQGTTGSTVLVIDEDLQIRGRHTEEFPQIYPQPGWVEHDPEAIMASVEASVAGAIESAGIDANDIAGIGITNQRETVVIWDRANGQAVHNAIVWQCRRTTSRCAELKSAGHEDLFRAKTGLLLDPYFSGTKVAWLLDNVSGARDRATRGELAFGTIDTFLVWRLTGGAAHVTDVSNASRTLLMDIGRLEWDEGLMDILGVPASILPEIRSSSEVYGVTQGFADLPDGIPVAGMAGDQQSALFGQACFGVGEAKCTYGTGCFILMNTGSKPVPSQNGLLTTVGWKIGDEVSYVLEGSAFIAGAAVQWLRDGLGIIESAPDVEGLAEQVEDSAGVYFVPALTGLGAPHWNAEARGLICGLTRGVTRSHLARATLEGIAYQNYEILEAMIADAGQTLTELKVDGGAAANNLLMQFQADQLGVSVNRPRVVETTAMGAAFLAGMGVGLWKSTQLEKMRRKDRIFTPKMKKKQRESLFSGWQAAVKRVL